MIHACPPADARAHMPTPTPILAPTLTLIYTTCRILPQVLGHGDPTKAVEQLQNDEHEINALRAVFNRYDKDFTGSVDTSELRVMLSDLGQKGNLSKDHLEGTIP